MSSWRLILASLAFHWRIHVAVGWGVVAATAVLCGAFIVGDSVRGSLRELVLDRLGNIDEILVGEQFFRLALASELAEQADFQRDFNAIAPAIVLQGTVEKPLRAETSRASGVTLLGVNEQFWRFDPDGPQPTIEVGEVILNAPLADELKAKVGDEVLLRIPTPSDVPGDSPLGKKTETIGSQRLKVSAILPAVGLAQFGLRPNQQTPRCAFTTLRDLASVVEQPEKVNALFVSGRPGVSTSPETSAVLARLLRQHMKPVDLGLKIESITLGEAETPVSQYINITSARMMLPEQTIAAAKTAYGKQGLQPALTYLANQLAHGERTVPYSTVAGIDASAALGPYLLEDSRPLADDEIVLVDWLARELDAAVGDEIAITYYEAESTHGELVEPAPAKFRVQAIVPLAEAGDKPTRANDDHFTPELRGVTDSATIGDWDLPFELTHEIRPQDETYWKDHRTTPKAYITLARAQELWRSRFGDTTTLRIPASKGLTVEEVWRRLALDPAKLNVEFLPVKRQGLQAASGTTPFNLLFIGFSFFIIAAALMLTMLLFRLGLEQRAREIGIQTAVGMARNWIRGQLLGEGLVVAALGAAGGTLVGVGYAWLMLAGLRTWWVAAITTPFLRLHVSPISLALGLSLGIVVTLLTIAWGLRQMRHVAVRHLLAGQASDAFDRSTHETRFARRLAQGILLVAILLSLTALPMQGEAQAGAFFGAGGLVLIASLVWIRAWLLGDQRRSGASPRLNVRRLAGRNAARHPTRSALTIGLVAAASFLIVAISAFRLEPTASGTGGIALVGETDDPIIPDLNTTSGRADLAFSDSDQRLLSLCDFYSLRVRSGDDASCLNLYQTRQPRILGIPPAFIERGQFAFSSSAAQTAQQRANPWLLLNGEQPGGTIPVILDAATATYSMHLSGVGAQFEMPGEQGQTLKLEVVGLLKNSVFQGSVLMSETNFRRRFPLISGYRYFLVALPDEAALNERVERALAPLAARAQRLTEARPNASQAPESPALRRAHEELRELRQLALQRDVLAERARQALETTLGDKGFDATNAETLLSGFLAVQNTYLSTFQSLGALGLLLGTFGLAAVQLRSVLERRGELALLRAAGFRRARLAQLVMWENLTLLSAGLATGAFAALVAVGPQFALGAAQVPWQSLLAMLGTVFVVGGLAGWAAVRAALNAPLLPALRGD